MKSGHCLYQLKKSVKDKKRKFTKSNTAGNEDCLNLQGVSYSALARTGLRENTIQALEPVSYETEYPILAINFVSIFNTSIPTAG